MGIDRMPLLSFGDVLSSGQESMSLSSSLLLGWLSLLSRWSFPLVELTLSDWCMMLKCFLRWGQFVTEAGLSLSVNIFSRCKLQIGFLYSRAPLRRHWPGLTNERPRGISTSYLWSPALTRPGVRLGAAISICRETDFIWITLLISDGIMANNGLWVWVFYSFIGSGKKKECNDAITENLCR